MDSELSHSVIGSYLNPPERMYPPSFIKNETSQIGHPVNLEVTTPKMINSPNNQGNINMKLYRKFGQATAWTKACCCYREESMIMH